MKMKIIKNISMLFIAAGLISSCVSDLDVTPIDPQLATPDKVLTSEAAFSQVLAKIYAGFAVSGQKGPAGDGDLAGLDEGHSQYWRGYFVCQELPTDECINGWNDGNLPKMSQITWGADNEFIRQFYYRAMYQVSLANEFIRQAKTYGKAEYTNLPTYKAEARFLRALAYWHALDLFGNGIPFADENDPIAAYFPAPAGKQGGAELFNYIESELLAIAGETDNKSEVLIDARSGMVGQADKAAAWMVLAKLYLNSKVYLGTENLDYYAKGRTFVNKVIGSGYSLIDNTQVSDSDVYTPYEFLFLADNYRCDNEIIYSIDIDGANSQSYGATTYILNASVGGNMIPGDYGTNGGWGGNRTTKALVEKFSASDMRALWFTDGQSLEIVNQDQFTEGYAVTKFKNKTRAGHDGINAGGFADINVPVFRLADAYLMAAEFDLRLGEAVSATNRSYISSIRERAGITSALPEVTLDFILDERARELYWECHRRTDLIRFGKFTKGYNWPFKGNAKQGQDVNDKYNVMPIPFSDITANPNLIQNKDY